MCGTDHGLEIFGEQHQHCQLANLYGYLTWQTYMRISDRKEVELVADCHGAIEVFLITATRPAFHSMTTSTESLKHIERAHELVPAFGVEVCPAALQTEQKKKRLARSSPK